MASSEEARLRTRLGDAESGMARAQKELDVLQRELAASQADAEAAASGMARAREELGAVRREVATDAEEAAALGRHLKEESEWLPSSEVPGLRKRLGDAGKDTESGMAELRGELAQAEEGLAKANAEVERLGEELDAVRRELAASEEGVVGLRTRLGDAEAPAACEERLAALQASTVQERSAMEAEIAKTLLELEEARGELDASRASLLDLTDALKEESERLSSSEVVGLRKRLGDVEARAASGMAKLEADLEEELLLPWGKTVAGAQEVGALREELDAVRRELSASQAQAEEGLAKANAELFGMARAREELDAVRREVAARTADAEEAARHMEEQRVRADALQAELSAAQRNAAARGKQLEEESAAMDQERRSMEAGLAEMNEALSDVQAQLAASKAVVLAGMAGAVESVQGVLQTSGQTVAGLQGEVVQLEERLGTELAAHEIVKHAWDQALLEVMELEKGRSSMGGTIEELQAEVTRLTVARTLEEAHQEKEREKADALQAELSAAQQNAAACEQQLRDAESGMARAREEVAVRTADAEEAAALRRQLKEESAAMQASADQERSAMEAEIARMRLELKVAREELNASKASLLDSMGVAAALEDVRDMSDQKIAGLQSEVGRLERRLEEEESAHQTGDDALVEVMESGNGLAEVRGSLGGTVEGLSRKMVRRTAEESSDAGAHEQLLATEAVSTPPPRSWVEGQ